MTNREWMIVAVLLALGALAPAARGESELDQRHPQAKSASDPALAAIGLLTGTATRCTGFLAGSDRVVVTAAHCVLDATGKPSQDRFDFQPGYRDNTGARVFGARVVVNGAWRPSGDPQSVEPVAEDWAILLTDAPTGIAPLPLAGDVSPDQIGDLSLSAVGYSVDVENGRFVTADVPCRATRVEGFRIHHTCRGSLGAAGSPLFAIDADDVRGALVGLVVRGAAGSTAERLAIGHLMIVAGVHGIPRIDYGGRAVVLGAFVNAAKVAATGAQISAMK